MVNVKMKKNALVFKDYFTEIQSESEIILRAVRADIVKNVIQRAGIVCRAFSPSDPGHCLRFLNIYARWLLIVTGPGQWCLTEGRIFRDNYGSVV